MGQPLLHHPRQLLAGPAPSLKALYLTNNFFNQPVPWDIFPAQLVDLRLSNNSVSGCLPATELLRLASLATLYADNNKLNCSLPPGPSLPASLRNLSLVSEELGLGGWL